MGDSGYYQNKVQVISSILLGRGKQERDTSSLAVSENMKISLGRFIFLIVVEVTLKTNNINHSKHIFACADVECIFF
jgi:hypothetical protein